MFDYKEVIVLNNFYTIYGRRKVLQFKFRFDPVPFIHKSSHYSYFRKPRTTQERKITCGHIQEKLYKKGRRKPVNLPNTWDDIAYSSKNIKGWKHQSKKRKQWL